MSEIELAERLERLEGDNRRLKGFAFLVLVLTTALATIYATQPVPDVIKAHEFEVVDSSGSVRARLRMQPPYPTKLREALRSIAPGFTEQPSPELWMGTSFTQNGQAGLVQTVLSADQLTLSARGGGRGVQTANLEQDGLIVVAQRPIVTLSDTQGFQLSLGSTNTATPATGATQNTSAASIVMFGNDKHHHVIWKAP